MTYLSVPKNRLSLLEDLDIKAEYDNNKIFISYSMNASLIKHKNKINEYKNTWDTYKKFINPYEYIHTIVPGYGMSISNYRPISRSYYKFIEMYYNFDLDVVFTKKINSFHLAEGPGGFIEAINNIRSSLSYSKADKYTGMTLINKHNNSPNWSYLKENFNDKFNLEYGESKTGNILLSENLNYCYKKYGPTQDLITADGGFDFSKDYNNQELDSSKLIYAQFCYGIFLQNIDGVFIMKLYDTFYKLNCDIILILSILYQSIQIIKPHTSRCANSERYIVAKKFKDINLKPYFDVFNNILKESKHHKSISTILPEYMPLSFKNHIEEMNIVFGATQIEWITKIIQAIETKQNKVLTSNIKKCLYWCKKYNQGYNNIEN